MCRQDKKPTFIQWAAPYGWSSLAQTGDAVLVHVNSPKTTDQTRVPSGRVVVYSADTGKQTQSITVPALANKDAHCLALWHDQLAVFLLPKSFVIVNFARHTSKIIPFDGKIDSPPDLHPLWVEPATVRVTQNRNISSRAKSTTYR